jgi:hypothetical protein
MIRFLVEANAFLYEFPDNIIFRDSANGDMKLIEYHRGEFIYRNYIIGFRSTHGTILIIKSGKPVWILTYEGGVLDHGSSEETVRKIYGFVRRNIARSTLCHPIRGPNGCREGKMNYSNSFFGNTNKFNGSENVTLEDQTLIYRLNYSGGDVIF